MKIIVIGAVNSTRILLEEMLKLHIHIDMVFSLDETVSSGVSGYYPLHDFAREAGIPFQKYKKINDDVNIEIMKSIEPDYIFAIGFSQLVSKKILDIPKYGVIGCHPSDLPKYRGRAVIVWQMLCGEKQSKVTLFKIEEGADTGDIIDQEPYSIEENDYAIDVLNRADSALVRLYRRALPHIIQGDFSLRKQDESEATYALKRTPEDGRIDWSCDGSTIEKLIHAASYPYPGAFSMYKGTTMVTYWKAHMEYTRKYIGFPGQIASVKPSELVILTKDGELVVTDYEIKDDVRLIVGNRFY